jgi:hypothetical protein
MSSSSLRTVSVLFKHLDLDRLLADDPFQLGDLRLVDFTGAAAHRAVTGQGGLAAFEELIASVIVGGLADTVISTEFRDIGRFLQALEDDGKLLLDRFS